MTPLALVRRAAFAAAATPIVLATGWRIARLERRLGLGALVAELRRAGERPLPAGLRRPEFLAGTVEILLPVVSPRHYGPCLRRALVLLELWSRCGLQPDLHLGFGLRTPDRAGHAWLTARAADGVVLRASGPAGHQEAFVL